LAARSTMSTAMMIAAHMPKVTIPFIPNPP
jgi:hypothetical protein